jgi:flagellar hook-associated protein 2
MSIPSSGSTSLSTALAATAPVNAPITNVIPPEQISGLASGLDTASIISALMLVAEQPELQLQNQITVETDRESAYQNVLDQLNTLTTSYQSLTDVSTWAPTQSVSSSDPTTVQATSTGGAAAGAYEVEVTELARANQFTASGATTAAANDTIQITTASGTVDVPIDAGDSLATIAQKITTTPSSGVYATILNGNLVISNQQTGTANAIESITTNGTSGLSFSQTQTAQDASFSIDGTPYTSGSNPVTTAMAGVTLSLTGQTSSATTVLVGQATPNTQAITSSLTSFVNEYNSVITSLETQLNTPPVTDPQSASDYATGVLYQDQGLESLLTQLQDSVMDPSSGGGAFTALAEVGVSTGDPVGSGAISQSSLDGLLTVDTSTFEDALNSNFQSVQTLFTNPSSDYNSQGLGERLNTLLNSYTAPSVVGGYLNEQIAGEGSMITSLQDQVANWQQILATKQQNYETEFTNMESALEGTQSVSAQLTGDIGSLSSSSSTGA